MTKASNTDEQTSLSEAAEIYAQAAIGGRLVLGKRPVVLVVDLQRGFTEEAGPLGADLTEPVLATRRLLDVARRQAVPVIFTVIAYASADDVGLWVRKVPSLAQLQVGSRWVELDPRLGRTSAEPVIEKHGASALHDTELVSLLRRVQSDSVVLCGAATSGCVRASAVDLMQHGYPALVPAECCGDRARGPHVANLFDISAKYADVVELDEAICYLGKAAGS